jgi:hypothetical protein
MKVRGWLTGSRAHSGRPAERQAVLSNWDGQSGGIFWFSSIHKTDKLARAEAVSQFKGLQIVWGKSP